MREVAGSGLSSAGNQREDKGRPLSRLSWNSGWGPQSPLTFLDLAHLARGLMGVPTNPKVPKAMVCPGYLCGSDCAGPGGTEDM